MHSCDTRLSPFSLALAMSAGIARASTEDDRRAVAALDTEFQAAVKHHDAATIDRIQHPGMVLVLGDGRVFTKADHLQARDEKKIQLRDPGRGGGNAVSARARRHGRRHRAARLKGTNDGAPFDRRLWFSDTYVRTREGWKYFFGQASLALPDAAAPRR